MFSINLYGVCARVRVGGAGGGDERPDEDVDEVHHEALLGHGERHAAQWQFKRLFVGQSFGPSVKLKYQG